jgi:hypothetical protein
LEEFAGLDGPDLAAFCKLLRMEGGQEGYWAQRNLLFQDVRGYLPEADVDGPVQLKELVTQKALSQNAANPSITKMDVLRALGTDETGLFPAPCLIEPVPGVVPREQEAELVDSIVNAGARPVLLHAAAGVGKTVFSTRIQMRLPPGSVCILYDCFGNGEYRSPSRYRHRHKTGLVQIANELAGKGLCDPLIPAASADSSAYLAVFLHRLKQGIASIRAEKPTALLCIVVDAADNAQIAAEEINEAPLLFVTCFAKRFPKAFAWLLSAERSGKLYWIHLPKSCRWSCALLAGMKPRSTSATAFQMPRTATWMSFIR